MRTSAILLLILIAPVVSAAEPSPQAVEFFEKKVRPLLATACFECHGPNKQRSGLRLDSRERILKGGDIGLVLDPGHPDKSRLVAAIGYKDELKMPPRGKLTDEQIADLTTWVKMGAPWPGKDAVAQGPSGTFDLEARRKSHWAWQPLKIVLPPAVKNTAWPRGAIDCFILARLEAAGLAPAPAADKRTLLRRVTFDLTGLPPTPAAIHAFLADSSPEAYEKVVDGLLKSSAYGERWARHWLDLVRFAETRGHEFDFEIPEAYKYRDYVIRAFNADVPYDQLVREHVAGDLLREPRRHPTERTNESILATGFWFLGEGKHSPVDIRVDGGDRRDNQIDVFAKTFLGLTVSCARCHDHKFDAISSMDYYALAGYIQSSRHVRAFLDPPERVGKPLAELGSLQSDAKRLAIPRAASVLMARVEKMLESMRESRPRLDPKKAGELFEAWRALVDPALPEGAEAFAARRRGLVEQRKARAARAAASPHVAVTDFASSGYREVSLTGDSFGTAPSRAGDVLLRPDGGVRELVPPGQARSDGASVRLQGALRTKTIPIDKKRLWVRAAGRGVHVRIVVDNYQIIRSPLHGHMDYAINSGDKFQWHATDLGMAAGMHGYIEFLDDGDGWAAIDRVLLSDGGPPEDAPNGLLTRLLDDAAANNANALAKKFTDALREMVAQWREGKLDGLPDAADRVALLNDLLRADVLDPSPAPPSAELTRLAGLIRQAEAKLPVPQRALAMADGTGFDEYVHVRGNYKNRGPAVPRRLPEAIAGVNQPAPKEGSGRLELAERMLAPSNPLLPRVMVNRLWQHHFGEGIVRSVDDFGVQGQAPSHPELLDWLAAEFRRQGWSMKAMHRLMVTSSAYRMASKADPAADMADPQNRLWHRMPIRRLEGEAIRDAILSVSGRLDRTMEGPGVLPHLTPFMVGRGRPGSGPLDGNGRRSIYENVRRNFLNPMFLAFDYPIPFSTMGRRGVSNVPAQALTLLNNPLVIQQSRRWADRILAEPGLTREQRVTRMYESAFGREPTVEELADALGFLAEQGKEYGSADDPRTWADLGHVLFNGKEFIFIN